MSVCAIEETGVFQLEDEARNLQFRLIAADCLQIDGHQVNLRREGDPCLIWGTKVT